MELTAATGTFGSADWIHLARTRTWPSVVAERLPWVHVHGETLAQARNEALERVDTEWVCFVDADDSLDPGYVEAMAKGTCDLRAPSVCYVRDGDRQTPRVPRVSGHHHACKAECLADGNFACIGTVVRTELLRSVGGFGEFAWSEDWAAWASCWKAGGTVEPIPDAVYVAHVNWESRNRAPDREFKDRVHWEIHRAVWPELYAA